MRNALLSISALVIATQAIAQDNPWRWSLSTGPTLATHNPNALTCPTTCTFVPSDQRVISGAEHGKFNIALGGGRRWNGTALSVRAEVMYNRSESPFHRRWPPIIFGPDTTSLRSYEQNAPIDEIVAATLGLEWDALPTKAVSPYVLTSFGWGVNRIRWNSDTASKRIDSRRTEDAPLVSLGAGVRARLGKHEMFFEWRRYHAVIAQMPGATITPFSVGFRY